MSNKKLLKTKTARRDRAAVCEAENDIKQYLNGCYDSSPPWELSQVEADKIYENRGQLHETLMARLSAKSAGAKYIAARINSGAEPDLRKLAAEWWCHRAIKRELTTIELQEIGATASDLRAIGVKTGWQARRFFDLYKEVQVKDRVWGSCYQVSQKKVLMVSTTPNFNRLPTWVKHGLIKYAPVHVERVGNIWRLPDCIKAWKWNPNLPKRVAERVGKMPFKSRIIAAIAWQETGYYGFHNNSRRRGGDGDRATVIQSFWDCFRSMAQQSLLCLLPKLIEAWGNEKRWGTIRCIVERWMELPYKSLEDEWVPDLEQVENLICTYGDIRIACQHLFGVNGKATVKAFQSCQSKDVWKWASALAQGNADAVQKILSMDSPIAWEPDAVNFLLSLPMVSRLRMLQATKFKYRGQVQPISPDHVRDTGYLWSNIKSKPKLGRVRCWFSVHETLAAAFVKELPDEALPIPAGWERVDGLCAVDGSWELEFPKRVATLKYYGQTFNNCVGGYGPAIKSGRSVIFVIREHGLLTHCVEMEPNGNCRQFYRARNRSGDEAIRSSVLAALRQAGFKIDDK